MALDDQNTRWISRTTEIIDMTETTLNLLDAQGDNVLPDQILATIQGVIEASDDAIDTDAPAGESPAGELLSPFFEKLRWFCALEGGLSAPELSNAFADLNQAAAEARLLLSTDDRLEAWTVDEVIADFQHEYRISLLSTMTANNALVNRLGAWQRMKGEGKNPGEFLDVARQEFVSERSNSTVGMSALEGLLTAPAVVMTPATVSAGMQDLFSGGTPPALFRMSYAQWFTSVFASWDDVYRPRLATAHGSDAEGNPWTKDDIRSTFFNDLRMIRNDLVHKKGICYQSADNGLIDWVRRGELIAPTPRQMLSLLDLFPETELREAPTRAPSTTQNNEKLPWEFPRDWVDSVKDHVLAVQQNKKKRPAVIMAVIDEWINKAKEKQSQQEG